MGLFSLEVVPISELGVGYISIIPEVSQVSKGIRSALNNAEPMVEKQGQSMGGRISSGMGKALKVGVAGVGAAAGAGLGASITKGLGRLSGIENAQAKLSGLGHSAGEVGGIMDSALASVRGTSYGLEEAATIAASAVAAGIQPGAELERTLTLTGDAAAIAGRDLSEMGSIINQVATSDMMQMDNANRLMDAGIPILQMVADEMGVTAAEAREMASAGEISFEIFQNALESGVSGAALEAGDTTRGAFANLGAAAGRLGATLAGPFYDQAAGAFSGITGAVDELDARMGPVMAQFGTWLTDSGLPQLKTFATDAYDAIVMGLGSSDVQSRIARTSTAISMVWEAGREVAPAMLEIAGALGEASAALGVGAWDLFIATLTGVGSVAKIITPPLEAISGIMSDHPGLVTAAVAAWAAFKTVPGIISRVRPPVDRMTEGMRDGAGGAMELARGVGDMRRYFQDTGREIGVFDAAMRVMGSSSNDTLRQIGVAYTNTSAPIKQFSSDQRAAGRAAVDTAAEVGGGWNTIDAMVANAGRGVTASVSNMAGTMVGVGAAGFAGLKSAASGVVNFLGGPWAVGLMAAADIVTGMVGASNNSKAAQERMAEASRKAAEAHRELQTAVAGTTGQLEGEGLDAAIRVATAEIDQLRAEAEQTAPILGGLIEVLSAPHLEMWEQGFWNAEFNEYRAEVGLAQDALRELEGAARDLEIPMSDLNRVVAEGGPEYDALVAALLESGDAGAHAAAELQSTRAEIERSVEAGRDLSPAFADAAEAVDVLADSASSADDNLSALRTIMQQMGYLPTDAANAMFEAVEAVDEIAEAAAEAMDPVGGLGSELLGVDGALNPASDNAKILHEQLSTLGDELLNVATNGGDIDTLMRDNISPALERMAESAGLSSDEMAELARQYGIVPEFVETALRLEGAEGVERDLAAVAVAAQAAEGERFVEVRLEDDDTKARLDEMGFSLANMPNGNTRVFLDDDDARDKLNYLLMEGFPAINLSEPTAQVNLDASGLEFTTEYAMAQLELLDTQQAIPWADLDISSLSAKQIDALNQVGLLDGQTPTPVAGMHIDQLTTNQQLALARVFALDGETPTPVADMITDPLTQKKNAAKGQLDALGRERPTPVADLDNIRVRDGADQANTWIGGITPFKAVTVAFNAVYNGFRNLVGGDSGGAGGSSNFADGAVRYAASGWLSDQQAQIAPGGQWITWAEDETQGESFIPHAQSKRGRSTQILAETARIFGMGLIDSGGNQVERDGTSVAPTSQTYFAEGGVRSPEEVLTFARGQQSAGERASRSLEGAPYVWGGINWGDCSGAMAALARFAVGIAPFASRFATMNQREALSGMGALNGLGSGPRISFGWFNGGPWGGHTSGTIHFGDGSALNVEMGGGRGNGQIGGGAAPASHSQYTDHAHIPLGPTSWEVAGVEGAGLSLPSFDHLSGAEVSAGGGGSVASTSVRGVNLKSGRSVSWGAASSLFQQAQAYTSGTPYWRQVGDNVGRDFTAAADYWLSKIPVRDVGGRFANDTVVQNRSGADELVLTNAQWRENSLIARALPAVGRGVTQAANVMQGAADQFAAAVDSADRQVLAAGRGFGGEFLGSAQIVRDAEQGLLETRANIATQADNITTAEEELADAKSELAKVEAEGGGLTTAQKRKLQDAEENLAKARAEGKPEKIADAEKKLARAREDADEALAKSEEKNAEAVRRAQDRVNKAEDQVVDTRVKHLDALNSLEAAERTVIAARYQAASDLASNLGEAWSVGMGHISSLFNELGRLAGVVDDTRQSVSKLQMQQQTASINQAKAALDLRVATLDVDRVRANGVISVAEAEWNLQQAREQAAVAGATGIEAMSGAMDRFYRTGKFSVGQLTSAQIESSREVQAAQWGVHVAQAQAALNQFEATRQQEVAQLRVAQATLEQTRIAGLLELQTKQLQQQTAILNGMTANQATGAAAGFGGVGNVGSGIGKLGGGILAGLAGFATAGPLGALAALPMAIGGLSDIVRGGIDIVNNRSEMEQAWGEMDLLGKLAIGGGSLLAGAAGIGGGYLGGAEGAAIGADAGAAIIDATVGSYEYAIASKLEAQDRRFDDQITAFEREMDDREHQLENKALERELDYLRERDRLESEVAYTEAMREAVSAPTEKLAKAYADAAEQERTRSKGYHDDQMRVSGEANDLLGQIAGGAGSPDMQDVVSLLTRLVSNTDPARAGVSGVDYQSARIG